MAFSAPSQADWSARKPAPDRSQAAPDAQTDKHPGHSSGRIHVMLQIDTDMIRFSFRKDFFTIHRGQLDKNKNGYNNESIPNLS